MSQPPLGSRDAASVTLPGIHARRSAASQQQQQQQQQQQTGFSHSARLPSGSPAARAPAIAAPLTARLAPATASAATYSASSGPTHPPGAFGSTYDTGAAPFRAMPRSAPENFTPLAPLPAGYTGNQPPASRVSLVDGQAAHSNNQAQIEHARQQRHAATAGPGQAPLPASPRRPYALAPGPNTLGPAGAVPPSLAATVNQSSSSSSSSGSGAGLSANDAAAVAARSPHALAAASRIGIIPPAAPGSAKALPLVFFLLGGPGAGTNSAARALAQQYALTPVSALDLLLAERATGSPAGALIARALNLPLVRKAGDHGNSNSNGGDTGSDASGSGSGRADGATTATLSGADGAAASYGDGSGGSGSTSGVRVTEAAAVAPCVTTGLVPADITLCLLQRVLDHHVSHGRTAFLVTGFPLSVGDWEAWALATKGYCNVGGVIYLDMPLQAQFDRLRAALDDARQECAITVPKKSSATQQQPPAITNASSSSSAVPGAGSLSSAAAAEAAAGAAISSGASVRGGGAGWGSTPAPATVYGTRRRPGSPSLSGDAGAGAGAAGARSTALTVPADVNANAAEHARLRSRKVFVLDEDAVDAALRLHATHGLRLRDVFIAAGRLKRVDATLSSADMAEAFRAHLAPFPSLALPFAGAGGARGAAGGGALLPWQGAAKPVLVLLTGGPGAGVTTVARRIMAKYRFVDVDVAALVREHTAATANTARGPGAGGNNNNSKDGLTARSSSKGNSGANDKAEKDKTSRFGKSLPAEVVVSLLQSFIEEELARRSHAQHFLLRGFPQNLASLDVFEAALGDKVDIKLVIFLDCPEATRKRRLMAAAAERAHTQSQLQAQSQASLTAQGSTGALGATRRSFHHSNSAASVSPAVLEHRALAQAEAKVSAKCQRFLLATMPLIEEMEARGVVQSVSASPAEKDVWRDVDRLLLARFPHMRKFAFAIPAALAPSKLHYVPVNPGTASAAAASADKHSGVVVASSPTASGFASADPSAAAGAGTEMVVYNSPSNASANGVSSSSSGGDSAAAQSMQRAVVVFMLGGPGSGRRQICARLSRDFSFQCIIAHDLLTAAARKGPPAQRELLARCLERGTPPPAEVTASLLRAEVVAHLGEGRRFFLIIGTPASQDDLDCWQQELSSFADVSHAVYLSCPVHVRIRRELHRLRGRGELAAIQHQQQQQRAAAAAARSATLSPASRHSKQASWAPTPTNANAANQSGASYSGAEPGQGVLTNTAPAGALYDAHSHSTGDEDGVVDEEAARALHAQNAFFTDYTLPMIESVLAHEPGALQPGMFVGTAARLPPAASHRDAATGRPLGFGLVEVPTHPISEEESYAAVKASFKHLLALSHAYREQHELFMQPERPAVVFLTGPPGAGRGTVAADILRQFALTLISVRDLLDAAANSTGADDHLIQYLQSANKEVPADLVVKQLLRAIDRAVKTDKKRFFLITGFPRLAADWAAWRQLAEPLVDVRAVVALACPPSVCEQRLIQKHLRIHASFAPEDASASAANDASASANGDSASAGSNAGSSTGGMTLSALRQDIVQSTAQLQMAIQPMMTHCAELDTAARLQAQGQPQSKPQAVAAGSSSTTALVPFAAPRAPASAVPGAASLPGAPRWPIVRSLDTNRSPAEVCEDAGALLGDLYPLRHEALLSRALALRAPPLNPTILRRMEEIRLREAAAAAAAAEADAAATAASAAAAAAAASASGEASPAAHPQSAANSASQPSPLSAQLTPLSPSSSVVADAVILAAAPGSGAEFVARIASQQYDLPWVCVTTLVQQFAESDYVPEGGGAQTLTSAGAAPSSVAAAGAGNDVAAVAGLSSLQNQTREAVRLALRNGYAPDPLTVLSLLRSRVRYLAEQRGARRVVITGLPLSVASALAAAAPTLDSLDALDPNSNASATANNSHIASKNPSDKNGDGSELPPSAVATWSLWERELGIAGVRLRGVIALDVPLPTLRRAIEHRENLARGIGANGHVNNARGGVVDGAAISRSRDVAEAVRAEIMMLRRSILPQIIALPAALASQLPEASSSAGFHFARVVSGSPCGAAQLHGVLDALQDTFRSDIDADPALFYRTDAPALPARPAPRQTELDESRGRIGLLTVIPREAYPPQPRNSTANAANGAASTKSASRALTVSAAQQQQQQDGSEGPELSPLHLLAGSGSSLASSSLLPLAFPHDPSSATPSSLLSAADRDAGLPLVRVLLLAGGPGSGRGTLGRALEKSYDMLYIDVEELLRQNCLNGTSAQSAVIAPHLASGVIVPSEVAAHVALAAVQAARRQRFFHVVLRGFPEEVAALQTWEVTLAPVSRIVAVLYLDADPAVRTQRALAHWRAVSGQYDPSAAASRAATGLPSGFVPPTPGDARWRGYPCSEAELMNRIAQFDSHTLPLLAELARRGLVVKLAAGAPPERVAADAEAALLRLNCRKSLDDAVRAAGLVAQDLRSPLPFLCVFVVGPPGAGKTTVAAQLAALYGVEHVHVPTVLRREAASRSPFGRVIARCETEGAPVPAPLLVDVLRTYITDRLLGMGEDYRAFATQYLLSQGSSGNEAAVARAREAALVRLTSPVFLVDGAQMEAATFDALQLMLGRSGSDPVMLHVSATMSKCADNLTARARVPPAAVRARLASFSLTGFTALSRALAAAASSSCGGAVAHAHIRDDDDADAAVLLRARPAFESLLARMMVMHPRYIAAVVAHNMARAPGVDLGAVATAAASLAPLALDDPAVARAAAASPAAVAAGEETARLATEAAVIMQRRAVVDAERHTVEQQIRDLETAIARLQPGQSLSAQHFPPGSVGDVPSAVASNKGALVPGTGGAGSSANSYSSASAGSAGDADSSVPTLRFLPLFVVGAPCAGKSHACAAIALATHAVHLDVPALLALEARDASSALGAVVRDFVRAASPVPPAAVTDILLAHVQRYAQHGQTTFLIEGFPASLDEWSHWCTALGLPPTPAPAAVARARATNGASAAAAFGDAFGAGEVPPSSLAGYFISVDAPYNVAAERFAARYRAEISQHAAAAPASTRRSSGNGSMALVPAGAHGHGHGHGHMGDEAADDPVHSVAARLAPGSQFPLVPASGSSSANAAAAASVSAASLRGFEDTYWARTEVR